MKNQVYKGDSIDVIAPAGGATSGAGLLVGAALFGIASTTVAAGAYVTLAMRGVFDVAKVSAQAWSVGDLIYWDNTAKNFTTTASANTKVGVAVAAAANPSTVGRVRINGTV